MAEAAGTTFLVMMVLMLLVVAFAPISQDDINNACRGRGGVIGYSDHSWGVTRGGATVVCGNHVAYKVR